MVASIPPRSLTPFEEIMFSGQLYDCTRDVEDTQLRAKFLHAKDLLYDYNLTRATEQAYRDELLQELLASVGENCYIEPPLYANWGFHTSIGDNFYSNFGLTLVDDAEIIIGDSVMIAPHVTLATAGHPLHPEQRARNYQFNRPITIGNRVWIGSGVIVLPGVTIGDGSVIGAGSVVTKDVAENVVALGNPCRVIREIDDSELTRMPVHPLGA